MKFNICIEIKGTASQIVEADNIEEAKKKAFEQGNWGENDYFWWYDDNSKVAVSSTDMQHPYENTDLSELPSDEWEYISR